jgi:hypothetical protein
MARASVQTPEISPCVVTEEVQLGLSQLEFRDQSSRKMLKNELRVFEETGVSS